MKLVRVTQMRAEEIASAQVRRRPLEQGCEGGVVQGVSFIDARASLGPNEQLATYYVLADEGRHLRETKDGPAITLPKLRRWCAEALGLEPQTIKFWFE